MRRLAAPGRVDTHCPYCALQCGMRLSGSTVEPRDFPVNRGGLCQKGWTSGALLDTPARLTTPLVRVDGELRATSWDAALDHVAAELARTRDRHGADAVAVFGGGGLTNEKAYQLGKFARVALGTAQIDYNGRFCMSSAAAAGTRAFGLDRGMPFPVEDLAGSDVVVLAGANPAETMPPFVQHLKGTLIVVDPRRTATAERAQLHLRPRPGTDLALALGILHAVVADGHLRADYTAERTTGFEETWRVVAAWWPERVERVTGVAARDQREAAALLAGARNAHILTGRGSEQHANGTDTVGAWINLALALGLPGRPGSGYGCLTGQGNGQGGREHGQKADQLPGYRKIVDPAARAHVASVWGVPAESLPGPGRSAYELLDSLGTEGGPRALLVFGSNVVVSAPRSSHIADRLSTLDLLVVADFVLSETAALADVVFPVTQWAEESGTMTNLEGRVLLRSPAVAVPDGVRSDLDLVHGLAIRLGQPEHRFPTDPEAVFEELRRASQGGPADYSGITYQRLRDGEPLHWPVPSTEHPGTPRMFLDRFAHPDGRARFTPVEHTGPAEPVDDEYPLIATTGRVLQHYQSGAQTRLVPELTAAVPEVFVQVHPDTATRAGLVDGRRARVVSRRGATEAVVRCDPTMRLDTVFLPFHFPGAQRANLLTNPALDPYSRMPEFKVCAVRLEAL
ncbi:assimilatory nitrate reductase catalytic subunit [Actinokineospora baliensis]|uniref:molybdopterin oxidoreductase family protein n=1 Tax=Actinokineospora baliensis TaxID=547056 RepID=UPI0027DDE783|nr:molybdopterin oxidoreductase family protein [Actinokineospora baliensis]MBM7772111.1 assimilatory nitrate reductase catalytic subunit [Actinokineospora baliensis]